MSGASLLAALALRIAGLALIAVGGGNALVPALHEQMVDATHWMTDADFAQAVGLAQVSPGPNMLLMPLIGWRIAGLAGALVTLVAFLVPSSTIAIVGSRLLVRFADAPFVRAFTWSLRPATGGLMLAAGYVLVATAARTWPAPSPAIPFALGLVALAVTVASLRFKLNPLVWLAAAALGGALF